MVIKKIKEILNNNIAILFFLAASFVFLGENLFSSGVFNHGDLSHPYFLESFENNYKYLFIDNTSVANIQSINRGLIFLPVIYFLKLFGISETKTFYAIFQFFIFFISQMGFYFFLKKIIKVENKTGLIIASVFFSLSPWIIEQVQAILFWTAYAFFPLFLTYAINLFVEKKKIKNCILLATILSFIGTTPQYLIFAVFIFFSILLYFTFVNIKQFGFIFKDYSIKIFMFGIIFLILNMYWILPVLKIYQDNNAVSPGYTNSSEMIDLFNRNTFFYKIYQGQEQWIYWYKEDKFLSNIMESSIWIFSSFIPIILLGSVLYEKKKYNFKYRYYFIPMFFVFFTLSLGSKLSIYRWIILESPFFSNFGWLLRVSGKFNFFIWLFLSICIAIFIQKENNNWKKIVAILLLVIFISPKAYKHLGFYYRPVPFPIEYLDLYKYLEKNKDFKTIYLAPYQYGFNKNKLKYQTSFLWNSDRVATNIIPLSSLSPSIGYYHLTIRSWQNKLYGKIYPEFLNKDPNSSIPEDLGRTYLAEANVNYLVFHNDIVSATKEGLEAVDILKEKTDLNFVKKFGESVYLFENPYAKRIIYLKDDREVIINKINPTKYKFKLQLDRPSYIYFAQVFDPLWKLKIDNKIVDPEEDKSIGMTKYKINKAGNIEGEIFYYPQYYYEIALKFISLPFFGFCLGYLGWELVRRKKNEKNI